MAGGLVLALLRIYGPKPLRRGWRSAYIDVFRAIPLLVLLVADLLRAALRRHPADLVRGGHGGPVAGLLRLRRRDLPRRHRGRAAAGSSRPPALGLPLVADDAAGGAAAGVRIVVPPITGNCINVMKDTALASVVAMPDLLKQATQAQALAANPTPLIGAALIYLALLLPLVRLVAALERRFAAARR